jgi:predicted dehydrogenase
MGRRRANAIVVDSDETRARSLAHDSKCEFLTDYEKIPGRPEVDCVVLCTPNNLHLPLSLRFLGQGQDVFCEKPLALTVTEGRSIVQQVERAHAIFQVGANVRHFGNVKMAKQLLGEGQIGRVLFARGWVGHDGWVLREEPWARENPAMGGGSLIDNGPHIVDLVRSILGELHPVSGYASCQFHKLDQGREDNFIALLSGPNGEPVSIQCSWTDWSGYLYLEVYGTTGSICVDNRVGRATVTLRPRDRKEEIHDFTAEGPVSFQREIDYFIGCIIGRSNPEPDASDGLRVLEIITGLYQSAASQPSQPRGNTIGNVAGTNVDRPSD